MIVNNMVVTIYNIITIMLFADTLGIGFYIINRIFSILRLCSAPVVMM